MIQRKFFFTEDTEDTDEIDHMEDEDDTLVSWAGPAKNLR